MYHYSVRRPEETTLLVAMGLRSERETEVLAAAVCSSAIRVKIGMMYLF